MADKQLLRNYTSMLLDECPFDLNAPGYPYESKFDGYRLLAELGQGKCDLMTRNAAEATAWFPEITRPLPLEAAFPGGLYVVDGEVCVLDDMGRSDFDRLHARANRRSRYGGCDPVVFCVFNLLVNKGNDITTMLYLKRKAPSSTPGVLVVGQFEQHGQSLCDGAVLPPALEGLPDPFAILPSQG